jgi:hypothetical protein
MSLLDVAREEERRRRAGLPPLPVPPRPTRGWLRRSGHSWRIRTAQGISVVPVLMIVVSLFAASSYSGAQLPRWQVGLFSAGMMASLPIGAVVFLLHGSIRCRVCGLRLGSCAEARRRGWRKWLWAATLEACPVCGDDGAASEASRLRWLEGGALREPAYWSRQRVLAALVAAAAITAALCWYVSRVKAS